MEFIARTVEDLSALKDAIRERDLRILRSENEELRAYLAVAQTYIERERLLYPVTNSQ